MNSINYTTLKYFLFLSIFIISLFSIKPHLYSATFDVQTTTDEVNNNGLCSFREAILNAQKNNQVNSTDCPAGDSASVDRIELDPGIYVLTIESGINNGFLQIGDDVEIIGLGSEPEDTVIDGNCNVRQPGTSSCTCGTPPNNRFDRELFAPLSNSNLTLNNLTLRGGNKAIASQANFDLTLEEVIIEGHVSGGSAIDIGHNFVATQTNVFITKSTFRDNCGGFGGAIQNQGQNLAISQSVFYNNFADFGGSAIITTQEPAFLTITAISNSTFSGNHSGGDTPSFCEGVICDEGATTIINSTIVRALDNWRSRIH